MPSFFTFTIVFCPLFVVKTLASKLSVATTGCLMTAYDAHSKVSWSFVRQQEEVTCSAGPPLVISNSTSLWIDPRSLLIKDYSKRNLECCYRRFWRADSKHSSLSTISDYLVEFDNECKPIDGVVNIVNEFVQVSCYSDGKLVEKDHHAFIVAGSKTPVKKRFQNEKPSVLILGLSSVSRQNVVRQMPKTVAYLRKFGSLQLDGYNKIGNGTFANVIAILTAWKEERFKEKCWPNTDIPLNKCTFLWDHFHKNGYITAFAEDGSKTGIFLKEKKGFRNQPTDVYGQTFMHVVEDSIDGGDSRMIRGGCSVLQHLLDYTTKFTLEMNRRRLPFWGLFWSRNVTLDHFNFPNIDKIYRGMLEKLSSAGVFENTIVIFMSDYGLRLGDYRQTFPGYVEERQPFLYMTMPSWMQAKYPSAWKNLKNNRWRLSTPYDVHVTMVNLLYPKAIGINMTYREGMSLFSSIPDSRTCKSAHIPDKDCTCDNNHVTHTSNVYVQYSAQAVVDKINALLHTETDICKPLHLIKVLKVRGITSDDPHVRKFVIKLTTSPGKGIFVTNVTFDVKQETTQIEGDISRMNWSHKSQCIKDKELKFYCFC